MTEPRIREAGPQDAGLLAERGRQTFTETFGRLYPPADLAAFLESAYDEGALRAQITAPGAAAWLLMIGGDALGYAQVGPCGLPHPQVQPRSGELKRLYLRSGSQNQGLGGRLFATAIAWLEPRYDDLWIGVWSENHGAQRFYERAGFAKVGEYGFAVGETVDREFILRRTAKRG